MLLFLKDWGTAKFLRYSSTTKSSTKNHASKDPKDAKCHFLLFTLTYHSDTPEILCFLRRRWWSLQKGTDPLHLEGQSIFPTKILYLPYKGKWNPIFISCNFFCQLMSNKHNNISFFSTYQFIWIDFKMVSTHYTDLEPHTNTYIRLFVAFSAYHCAKAVWIVWKFIAVILFHNNSFTFS